jgi:hypothetical protein
MEYRLILDGAKHIAMIANTDKGFEVRDYFIDCERRLLEAAPLRPAPPDDSSALVNRLKMELLLIRPMYVRIMHYHKMGSPPGDIAILLNKTMTKTAELLRKMHEMDLLPLDFIEWADRTVQLQAAKAVKAGRLPAPPKSRAVPAAPQQMALPLPDSRRKPAFPGLLIDAQAQVQADTTDLDGAKRTITGLSREMAKRVVLKKAIERFNTAYQSGTLAPDIMKAAALAFSERRGRGTRPGLSVRTFYRWEAEYFGDEDKT